MNVLGKTQTFFVPIETEVTNIDKERVVTIPYKKTFIDSEIFVQLHYQLLLIISRGSSQSESKNCDFFREYENAKDNLIKCKCLSCSKYYSNKIDEQLKKRFNSTLTFSNNDIGKVILLLSYFLIY